MRELSLAIATLLLPLTACAQNDTAPTRADTLRGALRPERTAFDVVHYALEVELLPASETLRGEVAVAYRGVEPADTIQLDLAPQLEITSLTQGGREVGFRREHGAVFIGLTSPTQPGRLDTVVVGYAGRPVAAVNPPWDGGLSWSRDTLGRPWIGVSCEGLGASAWWPNKDHLSDEPDSAAVAVIVPEPLEAIANGQPRGVEALPGGRRRFRYAVTYPINNYNVTLYAGHYAHFTDTLAGEAGTEPLELHYAVLDYNLDRAREHFRQVKPMLRCYEDLLGPYPFPRDGYRLVEAPYLGMEHQSGIAYGNDFQRGYAGGMIPDDMDWDYLIVHESGHEYFGNAVSVSDHAEMWLHESFTTYLEALYVECRYGSEAYRRYLDCQRALITNQEPLLGPLGVNYTDFASADYYFKGAWVLHTFREAVGDGPFLAVLRDFYRRHAIGHVQTTDWLAAVEERFGERYATFWRHYLERGNLPELRVAGGLGAGTTVASFHGVDPDFELPLDVAGRRIVVSGRPQTFPLSPSEWRSLDAAGYLIDWNPG